MQDSANTKKFYIALCVVFAACLHCKAIKTFFRAAEPAVFQLLLAYG